MEVAAVRDWDDSPVDGGGRGGGGGDCKQHGGGCGQGMG